jgi:hypothetical protein
MSGKASDVTVQWSTRPTSMRVATGLRTWDITYTVRFFSIDEQQWYGFSYHLYGASPLVSVLHPSYKNIRVRRADEEFKVGKVKCRLKTKMFSSKDVVWVVGGVEVPIRLTLR